MKKKLKGALVLLLSALAALLVFAGCSLGETKDEALENRNLTASVTYYANGGVFSNSKNERVLWYPENALTANIGKSEGGTVLSGGLSNSAEITRESYTFVGWYYVEMENGAPVFEDEAKGIYKLTEEVDFSVPISKDDTWGGNWIVAARWLKNTKVVVELLIDDATVEIPFDAEEEADNEYATGKTGFKNGEIVKEYAYKTSSDSLVGKTDDLDGVKEHKDKAPFELSGKGYTFVEYYTDKDCKQIVDWPMAQEEEDVKIYAKYVVGDWTIVKSSSQISQMLRTNGNYLMIKDIDASSLDPVSPITEFDHVIDGNGYKIMNLQVTKRQIQAGNEVGLFGEILAGAKIVNLTFENLTMTYDLKSGPAKLYVAFASMANKNVTIENVKISGSLTVSCAKNLDGTAMENCGNMETTENRYYGGYTNDADYVTASEGTGFVVDEGFTITIKK